jgi:glycerophosphoryl diester phosphodiesterase
MRRAGLAAALGGVLVTALVAGAGPQVAAHRGGALLWPENSLTAFRGALALGVDRVELDVHLSRDGEVVVIHDPTLDRTTRGRGAVRDHTADELAGLGVPRLREVLDLLRGARAGLLLEIKVGLEDARYPGIEPRVLGLLADAGMTDRTSVMAFEWDTLERLRALSPTVRLTGLLSRRGADRLGGVRVAAERLQALQANDLGIERTLLSGESVAAAWAAGLTIGVWTVNEPAELRAALAAGVDYVTTDRPDLALQLRRAP